MAVDQLPLSIIIYIVCRGSKNGVPTHFLENTKIHIVLLTSPDLVFSENVPKKCGF